MFPQRLQLFDEFLRPKNVASKNPLAKPIPPKKRHQSEREYVFFRRGHNYTPRDGTERRGEEKKKRTRERERERRGRGERERERNQTKA
jgi:hypothetical protein